MLWSSKMKASAALRTGVTLAEFLAMEDASDDKHLLWEGEVFPAVAMAGGTPEHAALSANVIVEIGVSLRGQRCRASASDSRARAANCTSRAMPWAR